MVAGPTGIEIVVRDCAPERVAAWSDAVAGPLTEPTEAVGASVYRTRLGTVVVQSEMEGPGGVGIWFQSAELPWVSSTACARQADREIGCVVWCVPGADYPEVHPLSPVSLEVSGQTSASSSSSRLLRIDWTSQTSLSKHALLLGMTVGSWQT